MSPVPLKITKLSSTVIDYSIYATQANYIFYGQTNTRVSYYPSAGILTDINNNGRYEYVLSIVDYPLNPIPLLVIGDEEEEINLSQKFFPNGAPKTGQTSFIYYADINGDGKKDIIASEAGLDYPPWTGSKIGIAVWSGDHFVNVSDLQPQTTSRAYAIAIADLNMDGKVDILIPAQGSIDINDSYIINYFDNNFNILKNPIPGYISNNLFGHTAIQSADFNNDGFNDLLFTGDWFSRNNRIVYFNKNGADTNSINVLPVGPLGEKAYEYGQINPGLLKEIISGPEVYSIVFDFNNDGKPDIFSLSENTTYYPPNTYTGSNTFNVNNVAKEGGYVYGPLTFSALKNIDGIKFNPINNAQSDLGNIYYRNAFPFDINSDGKLDVIGHFWSLDNPKKYGTTFFINDGLGNFTPLEAIDLFPDLAISRYPNQINNFLDLGWIVPIKIENNKLSGLQIIPGANETGLFTIQKFTAFDIENIKVQGSTILDINILDRNNFQFINLGSGNDNFSDKNNYYSSHIFKSILQISLELVSRNIADLPDLSVKINENTILSPTSFNGAYSNLQIIDIDISHISDLSSLELVFNNLKYIDQTQLSYAIIRKLSFLGNKISFAGALFDNGFAFDSEVAQMNGSGSIKFTKAALSSANTDISKIPYLNADIVDGGTGRDTSSYSGLASDYSIKHNESGTWSVWKNRTVNDLLTNVERLKFADTAIALDTSGVGGQAYRVYKAAFNRSPDLGGLGFWISGMDGGVSLNAVAQGFVNSAEFKAVYGANPTNAQIVTRFYDNVLGRAAESGGYNYWLGVLNSGQGSVAGVLAAFSESPENQAAVIGVIGNGILYTPYG